MVNLIQIAAKIRILPTLDKKAPPSVCSQSLGNWIVLKPHQWIGYSGSAHLRKRLQLWFRVPLCSINTVSSVPRSWNRAHTAWLHLSLSSERCEHWAHSTIYIHTVTNADYDSLKLLVLPLDEELRQVHHVTVALSAIASPALCHRQDVGGKHGWWRSHSRPQHLGCTPRPLWFWSSHI